MRINPFFDMSLWLCHHAGSNTLPCVLSALHQVCAGLGGVVAQINAGTDTFRHECLCYLNCNLNMTGHSLRPDRVHRCAARMLALLAVLSMTGRITYRVLSNNSEWSVQADAEDRPCAAPGRLQQDRTEGTSYALKFSLRSPAGQAAAALAQHAVL